MKVLLFATRCCRCLPRANKAVTNDASSLSGIILIVLVGKLTCYFIKGDPEFREAINVSYQVVNVGWYHLKGC
jgi:hypothetical protein